MLSPPNRAVALLAARLVCAPLAASDRIQAGLRGRAAGQPPAASGDFAQGWAGWMRMRGLAAVRLAFRQLPPSPEAGECLVSLILAAPARSLQTTQPADHLPPAQPTGADFEAALLDACGRSEPPQALALLERFCLWLRLCPENCELLTAQPALWQPQFARLLGRYAGEVVAAARGRGALAASALADSVASPPARRSKASGADVLTMLNELLCTYLVESLPLDPCWRALDLVLTLAQRLAADLPASTPKLRRLCRAVRMHTLSALPPAQPVRVRLNAVRGASDRWLRLRAAEGAAAMGAEAAMIGSLLALLGRGSLLALLDPLLVRAMMDDEADARLLTSLAGSFAHGLVGASTLAGRAACVAARQRLRELLWRDLEQGSAWAMLASHERAGAADESWPGRRKHVLHLLVSLALPLRRQVLEVRDVPGTQLQREMVEALVPPLQGPPAWMSGACSPEQFLAAFGASAWGPLLDAPLLREAAAALEADNAAQTAAAVSDAAQRVGLAQAAWASVAEEEAEQGAWEAPQEQGAAARAEERCELLECEDYWRRRVLQLPNSQLTDHAQASLVQQQSGGSAVRDGSVGDDARESEGSLAKLRQAAKLAKTVVRIASDGAVDDPQLGDEDEEDEAALDVGVADLGPRGGGSLRVSSGEAGGSPASPQRKSGQPAELPAEAAASSSSPAWLFDEPCELVWRGGIRQGALRAS
ncbi:hypothetical protein EMIHUDRAFT_231361 [Emiliania huxleyi CCMP1516]|uniref:Uncharacterized protein n=2 Tax=Emiliania huxleyi TaxID=2903 RepID=A0A0D3K7L0_EMIH1|nr:hypothetical protein EMIHUDRAFT_231361 [Emiliania huxleyi CCMP1516]EOD31745.1 hypothetical protein EMIHUDRAFT_231361 [Emiliania huxleyi CCMP1516]|eukprot:XP_005784174.1 hypothetical protein EMIHUDRAFT_231361 [Emiliania huxleyi CCMP1516]